MWRSSFCVLGQASRRFRLGHFSLQSNLDKACLPRVMSKYAKVHEDRNGPGDSRPTALEIVEDEGMIGKLSGKVCIVTGGSSGIGIETARALHETDATIYLAVRDIAKGEQVAKEILQSGKSHAKIEVIKLELDSLASVRSCAAEFQKRSRTLNILVNNAGVMACPESSTKDGFETQFGVNHLAHFLLFQLLKDSLLSSSSPGFPSRVVCLSSLEDNISRYTGHRSSPVLFDDLDLKKRGYNQWVAYGQSKTANIYMANEIERRFGSKGLHATSVHPGGIQTNLSRHLDPGMLAMFDSPPFKAMAKSPPQGAATTVWAAIGKEWLNKGGKYLEDCQISQPVTKQEDLSPLDNGYKPYAYDEELEKKLWKVSNELVGLPADS